EPGIDWLIGHLAVLRERKACGRPRSVAALEPAHGRLGQCARLADGKTGEDAVLRREHQPAARGNPWQRAVEPSADGKPRAGYVAAGVVLAARKIDNRYVVDFQKPGIVDG